jgi:hypothetical protein
VLFTKHLIGFVGPLSGGGSMNKRVLNGFLAVTLCLVALPARAHHSFGAEFDFTKPVTLHGTCVKWEMINPHSYLTVDVKNDDGTVTEWSVQAGAPSFLYRNGWRKDSVKPGDELIITGYSAKDGSHNAFAQRVQLPDGRRVLGGAIIGATPPPPPADGSVPAAPKSNP